MSTLRKRFIRDLKIQNYSDHTISNYVSSISQIGRYHDCCPSYLSAEQIIGFDRRKNTWLPFSYIWEEGKRPKEFMMPFSIFHCVLILISHSAPFVKKANCKTQISYQLAEGYQKLHCQQNPLKYVPYPNNHIELNDIKQYPLCRIHSNQSFYRQFHYQ